MKYRLPIGIDKCPASGTDRAASVLLSLLRRVKDAGETGRKPGTDRASIGHVQDHNQMIFKNKHLHNARFNF
ncbi:MAG: hypothetical protein BGO69_16260 [Bacteroidetes bacterium 46-16]|nr:MAG: hypothetical protein BGO69_16260 [Bacteroidetes bacterium 46-16]